MGRSAPPIASRDQNGVSDCTSAAPEASLPTRELVERRIEICAGEVRPQRVREDELRIVRLPEQEVREPHLARRAYHEVGIGQLWCVQARGKGRLVDSLGSDSVLDEPARRLDEL